MMQELMTYRNYFFIAFAILIPILGYAIFLQCKTLKNIKEEKERKRKEVLEGQEKRQKHIKESICVISMATVQEQCEISEACLRIANLLPLLDDIDHTETRWKPLFDMYDEIRGLKTLEERKAMRAAHRHQEDKQRYASEEKFHTEILHICQSLYDMTREKPNE